MSAESFHDRLMLVVHDEAVTALTRDGFERAQDMIDVQVKALASTLNCFAFQDSEVLEALLADAQRDLVNRAHERANSISRTVAAVQ